MNLYYSRGARLASLKDKSETVSGQIYIVTYHRAGFEVDQAQHAWIKTGEISLFRRKRDALAAIRKHIGSPRLPRPDSGHHHNGCYVSCYEI